MLPLVTAVGGGLLRDLLAGDGAFFWLNSPGIFHNGCLTAFLAFFLSQRWNPPQSLFQVADALALCFFAVAGTRKGISSGFTPSVCIALGVTTGVACGIIRDTLLNRLPVVFRKESHFMPPRAFSVA